MRDSREVQDLVGQDHPSEDHVMGLAYVEAPDEAQGVRVENHQVHHALEAHSNPVLARETEVLDNP